MGQKVMMAMAMFLAIVGLLFGLAGSMEMMPRNYANFAAGASLLLSGGVWSTFWIFGKSKSG